MAEIAIYVHREVGDDRHDWLRHQRGDVIEVLPDGTNWGREALRNPRFRMLRIPTRSEGEVLELHTFLSGEIDTYPPTPGRVLARRGFYFDVDSPLLPGPMRGWIANDRRRVPVYEAKMSVAEIISKFKKQRPQRAMPWLAGLSR